MTIAVIGATGRTGSEVVRGLLADGHQVRALVRNPEKARELFGDAPGLEVRPTTLPDPGDVTAGLDGSQTLFIAIGAVGLEGVIQRIALGAAAAVKLDQVVRVSVLNASAESRGINQRAHWSIDQSAVASGLPYATIRPAIYSASLLAGAAEIRATRQWTGIADTGRNALIDHRDAAQAIVRVLTDPSLWNTHYDITGPELLSWPDALKILSTELGEKVGFRVASPQLLLDRIIEIGLPAGTAELLIAREWATLAGENERQTTTLQELIGRANTVRSFLLEHLAAFA